MFEIKHYLFVLVHCFGYQLLKHIPVKGLSFGMGIENCIFSNKIN